MLGACVRDGGRGNLAGVSIGQQGYRALLLSVDRPLVPCGLKEWFGLPFGTHHSERTLEGRVVARAIGPDVERVRWVYDPSAESESLAFVHVRVCCQVECASMR